MCATEGGSEREGRERIKGGNEGIKGVTTMLPEEENVINKSYP